MQRLLVLATLLLVALAPTAAADREVNVDLTLSGADSEARASTGGAEASEGRSVDLGEPQTPPELQQVIELTAIQTEAEGDAGPIGFAAQASAEWARRGAEAIAETLPVIEENAPEVVATAGFFALLQALGVWRFLGIGAIGLYSRLTRSDLLDNQHRDRVYKLVQEEPGIGLSQVAQRTGLGWGTTVYHLDRLERAGFVASERGGLHKCFFPVGTLAREARKGIGALKADTTRSIAEFLVAKPGATQSELCAALGLSPSAASKQVSKLEEAGLVRREREWKTVRLMPDATLAPLLEGQASSTPPVLAAPLAA